MDETKIKLDVVEQFTNGKKSGGRYDLIWEADGYTARIYINDREDLRKLRDFLIKEISDMEAKDLVYFSR